MAGSRQIGATPRIARPRRVVPSFAVPLARLSQALALIVPTKLQTTTFPALRFPVLAPFSLVVLSRVVTATPKQASSELAFTALSWPVAFPMPALFLCRTERWITALATAHLV